MDVAQSSTSTTPGMVVNDDDNCRSWGGFKPSDAALVSSTHHLQLSDTISTNARFSDIGSRLTDQAIREEARTTQNMIAILGKELAEKNAAVEKTVLEKTHALEKEVYELKCCTCSGQTELKAYLQDSKIADLQAKIAELTCKLPAVK